MGRNRTKTIVLLGIGVTVCFFIAIQMSSSSELDSPIVYMNSQAYNAALQQGNAVHLQTQQEPPGKSDQSSSAKRSQINSSVNANQIREYDKHVRIYRDSNNINDNEGEDNKLIPKDYYGESSATSTLQLQKQFDGLASTDSKLRNTNSNDAITSVPSMTLTNSLNNDITIIPEEPTIWVVTPTFYRPEQRPELTRLAQALLPVRNFVHWIIVDDVTHGSPQSFNHLEGFLKRFPIYHTILKSFPPKTDTKIVGKPRGVGGRTAAIQWLRKHAADKEGVVYFADDDNTYDSDIFRQVKF